MLVTGLQEDSSRGPSEQAKQPAAGDTPPVVRCGQPTGAPALYGAGGYASIRFLSSGRDSVPPRGRAQPRFRGGFRLLWTGLRSGRVAAQRLHPWPGGERSPVSLRSELVDPKKPQQARAQASTRRSLNRYASRPAKKQEPRPGAGERPSGDRLEGWQVGTARVMTGRSSPPSAASMSPQAAVCFQGHPGRTRDRWDR